MVGFGLNGPIQNIFFIYKTKADTFLFASLPINNCFTCTWKTYSLLAGWLDCPSFGQEIYGMIPSKVPLGESFNDCILPGKRYSFKQVIHQQRVLGRKVSGIFFRKSNTSFRFFVSPFFVLLFHWIFLQFWYLFYQLHSLLLVLIRTI